MAEEEGADKTEQPSQRHRDQARERGQFAFSQELNNSLLLLAGTIGLWLSGMSLVGGIRSDFQSHLRHTRVELSIGDVQSLIVGLLTRGVNLTGTLLAVVFAVGLASNLSQAGFHINTESLGPKWEKINPAMNWDRIFSREGLIRGGFAITKVIMVSTAAWWVLSDRGQVIASLNTGVLSQSVATAWGLAIELLIAASAVLVVIGTIDYGWQWYRNEQMLKMSREELKQENKDDTGDPLIRQKRRQRAQELALQSRMLEEVPKATLVITNPTHLAIALRYERGVMSAPVVIAKGRDQFAFLIAARARRHGIPVVERKPVAQALFKMVKVGQEIPQSLYVAVSEVLGYIYRLRGTQV